MTDTDLGAQDVLAAVRFRTDGDVDDETLTHLRAKTGAVLARPGLPAVSGRVTIVRDTAHHVALPWAALASVQVGDRHVVVHAREADALALADRLEDRLRAQVERSAHRAESARRTAGPPPWRGGVAGEGHGLLPAEGSSPAA
ncbi:hypothetical protein ACWD4G_07960 [Streptomyces sp. NPDC002643]